MLRSYKRQVGMEGNLFERKQLNGHVQRMIDTSLPKQVTKWIPYPPPQWENTTKNTERRYTKSQRAKETL